MALLAKIGNIELYTEVPYDDEEAFKKQVKDPSIWFRGKDSIGWLPLSNIKKHDFKVGKWLKFKHFEIDDTTKFDVELKELLEDVSKSIRENFLKIWREQNNRLSIEEKNKFYEINKKMK